MMMQINRRSKLHEIRKLPIGLVAVILAALLPGAVSALTPGFPEAAVVKGKTPAGHPYMNGGVSLDEQRIMESVVRPYNLKLIFTRRAGVPAAPSFVLIGANDGRGIEKIVVRGPWLYIQLPTGGYTIMARFPRRVVLVKDLFVQEGQRRTYWLRGD